MELDRLVMPGAEIQSEIMKAAAGFQNSILKTWFPIPNFVFDNPVTFDTADGVFNPNSDRRKPPIKVFIQIRQRLASRLLLGLQNSHIVEAKALEAGILT